MRCRIGLHRWRRQGVLTGVITDLLWSRCRDCRKQRYIEIYMGFVA